MAAFDKPPTGQVPSASCEGVCGAPACPVGSGGGPGRTSGHSCGSGGGPGLLSPLCSVRKFFGADGVQPQHPILPALWGLCTPVPAYSAATLPCCHSAVIRGGLTGASVFCFLMGGSGAVLGGSPLPTGVLSAGIMAGSRFSMLDPVKTLKCNSWLFSGGVPAATLLCYLWVVFCGWYLSGGWHGALLGGLVVVGS